MHSMVSSRKSKNYDTSDFLIPAGLSSLRCFVTHPGDISSSEQQVLHEIVLFAAGCGVHN